MEDDTRRIKIRERYIVYPFFGVYNSKKPKVS